jgi:hypothetical protein
MHATGQLLQMCDFHPVVSVDFFSPFDICEVVGNSEHPDRPLAIFESCPSHLSTMQAPQLSSVAAIAFPVFFFQSYNRRCASYLAVKNIEPALGGGCMCRKVSSPNRRLRLRLLILLPMTQSVVRCPTSDVFARKATLGRGDGDQSS